MLESADPEQDPNDWAKDILHITVEVDQGNNQYYICYLVACYGVVAVTLLSQVTMLATVQAQMQHFTAQQHCQECWQLLQ